METSSVCYPLVGVHTMDTYAESYTYDAWLHNPYSKLDIGHPDAEVYVVVIAEVMVYENDMPVVLIRTAKVFDDFDSDSWVPPTQDQKDFWDLDARVQEHYLWGQQECQECGHKLRLHLEIEPDHFSCCESSCKCYGDRYSVEP